LNRICPVLHFALPGWLCHHAHEKTRGPVVAT
jgi:hypothetical protein